VNAFSLRKFSPNMPDAIVFCGLLMLAHITLTGGRIAVMLAGIELGLSTFAIGFVIALFAILPMFLSVHAGRLLDSTGAFKPLRIASFLALGGIALPFIWLDWRALAIAAVLVGIGHMVFQVAIQAQLGAAGPAERLKNYSWLAIALAISGFTGPLLAGISIDNLGHRWAFGLLAVCPLIALYGVYKKRPRFRQETIRPAPTEQRHKITDLLKIRPLRYAFAANLLLSGAWDTLMFLVPLYGVQRGLSATTIGAILACFALATFLIRLALPLIQRRASPWQLVHAALITASLNFLIFPFFSEVWALMTLSFLLGLSLGCTQPSILALLQQHAPDGRKSEAFGIRMALINGSQVSLPMAFGILGTLVGVSPLFWASAIAVATGAWFTRRAGKSANPTD
jgi:MFS family permease